MEYKAIDGWHTPKKQQVRIGSNTEKRIEVVYKKRQKEKPKTTQQIHKLCSDIKCNHYEFITTGIISILEKIISDCNKLKKLDPNINLDCKIICEHDQATLDRIKK